MNALVFGGSLAAILALAGTAWALKLGRVDRLIDDPDAALRHAADALSGFAPVAAVVGEDGRAALVLGEGQRVAVLKAHGAHVAAREITWTDVRSTASGIVIETRERRFGCVRLTGVNVLDVRRLAPQLTTV